MEQPAITQIKGTLYRYTLYQQYTDILHTQQYTDTFYTLQYTDTLYTQKYTVTLYIHFQIGFYTKKLKQHTIVKLYN